MERRSFLKGLFGLAAAGVVGASLPMNEAAAATVETPAMPAAPVDSRDAAVDGQFRAMRRARRQERRAMRQQRRARRQERRAMRQERRAMRRARRGF